MNKNNTKTQLEKAFEQVSDVFETHIKDSDIGAFFMASADTNHLAVSFSGTPQQQFTVLCQFLFEHPDHIEFFRAAVECAEDYYTPKPKTSNELLN